MKSKEKRLALVKGGRGNSSSHSRYPSVLVALPHPSSGSKKYRHLKSKQINFFRQAFLDKKIHIHIINIPSAKTKRGQKISFNQYTQRENKERTENFLDRRILTRLTCFVPMQRDS
jgi:hypothetical protein